MWIALVLSGSSGRLIVSNSPVKLRKRLAVSVLLGGVFRALILLIRSMKCFSLLSIGTVTFVDTIPWSLVAVVSTPLMVVSFSIGMSLICSLTVAADVSFVSPATFWDDGTITVALVVVVLLMVRTVPFPAEIGLLECVAVGDVDSMSWVELMELVCCERRIADKAG